MKPFGLLMKRFYSLQELGSNDISSSYPNSCLKERQIICQYIRSTVSATCSRNDVSK